MVHWKNDVALTFDDVLLVPGPSDVLPKTVTTTTHLTANLALNNPVVSAAMDTVTEVDMAIRMAQEGGLGFIHKNMAIDEQVRQVKQVKRYESGIIRDAITIDPDATIEDVMVLRRQHNISGVPVVRNRQLLGIITNRDLRFESDLGRKVSELMTSKERLITVRDGASVTEVRQLMHQHRIEKVLIVDKDFNFTGMMTVRDMTSAREHPQATKDGHGQLCVGASVGVGPDAHERTMALVAAGVDVLLVDSAHGHARGVIEHVAWIRKQFPKINIIAGNIVTGEAALALAEAGADAVKVGIGPGSICTTRVVAGVGMPQITAILDVAQALQGKSTRIIADGGIRFSGDIAKALACGAHCVMLGSLLAGTDEAPGVKELYQGRTYKTYRGMGSLGSMTQQHGSKDRYFQGDVDRSSKLVPEGIEGRVPYRGALIDTMQQLIGGLRASMGYTGCESISVMHQRCQMVKITPSGQRESHVHDVTITKEAPNYYEK